jgi:hypothetical protein
MRKEWIRTDEERELRRIKDLNKQQRKLNKLSTIQQPIVNLPIVVRKKKRIIQPVKQDLVIRKIEPVKQKIKIYIFDFKLNFVFLDLSNKYVRYSS